MFDRFRRSWRHAALLGVLWLAGGTAVAQESPGFLLETVTVEGSRREASKGIIVAETLLETGRTYNERELREAVYRVKRLPFVLKAEFSLRKGSERGAYELVISVEETRPFFFAREHVIFTSPDDHTLNALGYAPSGWSLANFGLAGARLFLGSKGVAFASVSLGEGLQAGYTRYDLFGTGSVAGLSVGRNVCCPREVLPLGLSPELGALVTQRSDQIAGSLAMPLAGNHSVRVEARWFEGELSRLEPLLRFPNFEELSWESGESVTRRELDVKWFYDTADDPLFPGRGVTLSAGLEASDLEIPLLLPEDSALPAGGETKSRLFALAATGRKNWTLSSRQTVSAGLRTAVGRSQVEDLAFRGDLLPEMDLDTFETAADLRYSVSLWGPLRTRDQGDLRFELTGRYGYESIRPETAEGSTTHYLLNAGVVFRNAWGVFRAGFSYLDYEGAR